MHPDPDRGRLERRHRCASSPAIIPASTSPAPAVASQGGALAAMVARPSGEATTVSGPFSSTTAPERSAAARTRSSFERSGCLLLMSLNRRGNSPSCGVRTTCGCGEALIASNSRSGASAKLVSASASSTRPRGVDSALQHEIAGPFADTRARPDHAGIQPLVAEQFGKLDRRYRSGEPSPRSGRRRSPPAHPAAMPG